VKSTHSPQTAPQARRRGEESRICGTRNRRTIPSVPNNDTRFQQALPDALALIGAVRDRDPDRSHRVLASADTDAVAVVLAAMVDDSREVRELLRWSAYDVRLSPTCDPALDLSPPTTQSVHGTRSRYTAGCRGEGCRRAESEYQRERYLRHKNLRAAS
jgi:hypothetical protein